MILNNKFTLSYLPVLKKEFNNLLNNYVDDNYIVNDLNQFNNNLKKLVNNLKLLIEDDFDLNNFIYLTDIYINLAKIRNNNKINLVNEFGEIIETIEKLINEASMDDKVIVYNWLCDLKDHDIRFENERFFLEDLLNNNFERLLKFKNKVQPIDEIIFNNNEESDIRFLVVLRSFYMQAFNFSTTSIEEFVHQFTHYPEIREYEIRMLYDFQNYKKAKELIDENKDEDEIEDIPESEYAMYIEDYFENQNDSSNMSEEKSNNMQLN